MKDLLNLEDLRLESKE